MTEITVQPKRESFGYACTGFPTITQLIDYGLTEYEAKNACKNHAQREKRNKAVHKYERRSK